MEELEKKTLTETAVLFTLTGHVFLRDDASLEYRQQSLKEIHDGSVYKQVMSTVPEGILDGVYEELGSDFDVDPIVSSYLCGELDMVGIVKYYSDQTPYPESKALIQEKFLTNGYLSVPAIDLVSFSKYVEEAKENQTNFHKK